MRQVFPELPEEVREKIWEEFGVDARKRAELVQILQEWLLNQPHLPNYMDEGILKKFVIHCKGSVQLAKECIDMFFTLRTLIPEMLSNRDPKKEWFNIQTSNGATVPMPKLTHDNNRVVIFRYLGDDVNIFNAMEQTKVFYMVSDLRYKYDHCAGDVYIIDMEGATPALLAKFTPTLLKKADLYGLKVLKGKVKGVHIVNAPVYIDAFVSLLKRVISKPKIRDRIHVHSHGMDKLHEMVDKKVLPEEYGGDAGPVMQHWEAWKQFLLDHRDWFMEQETQKADESKRPTKAIVASDLFGFEGSFRQLSLD